MAKAHRTAKAKSQKPRRRPARSAPSGHADPGPTWSAPPGRGPTLFPGDLGAPAAAALEPYEAPFFAWLADSAHDAAQGQAAVENGPVAWAALQGLVAVAMTRGLGGDPARWGVTDVDELIAALDTAFPRSGEERDADEIPSVATVMLDALLLFLSFLDATGRWQGTRAQVAAAMARLTIAVDPDSSLARLSAGVRTGEDVEEATEVAAIVALPLVADVVDLLTVTDERRRAELAGEIGEEDGPTLEEAMTARTGADDDPLATRHLWNAAVVSRLIEVEGTAATVTPAGRALAACPADVMDDTRRVVLAWLVGAVTLPVVLTGDADLADALAGQVLAFVLPLLLRGLSATPIDTAHLDGALGAAGDDAPDEHRDAVRAGLRTLLGRLVRSGLLTEADGHYVVPVGLESLLVGAMDVVMSVQEAQATAARAASETP